MDVEGYTFEFVCEIKPLLNEDGGVKQFMPQYRYDNARQLSLNKFGSGPFCKFTIPRGYRASGVYVVAIDDQHRYVGECADLSSRFNSGYGNISPKNCFKGGQETNCRLNNLVLTAAMNGERISLFFFQTADYKAMEAALRAAVRFPWNRI